MKDERKDYKVGYGKPPEESRFKKGRSGNPKGRPRGSKNVATLFNQIARQEITVKENGRSVIMTRMQAVLHQLSNQAVRQSGGHEALSPALPGARGEGDSSRVANAPQERDVAVFATVLKRMQRFASQPRKEGEAA